MKGFESLMQLTDRAKNSPFWLWALNKMIGWAIPFNRPHGFRLLEIGENHVKTTSSYRRCNHNHVRGIHACAIATVAEFSAGFMLLTRLNPKFYRLIMSRIEVDYHYQAKERIVSETHISSTDLETKVIEPLENQESVSIKMESRVKDISGNDIALAFTTWQIKRWDRVKTEV